MSDYDLSFHTKPVFVLTSDQDWAPTWASEAYLRAVESRGLPLHMFRTNSCEVLDLAYRQGKITQGWHPNFLPGSTHGETPSDVVKHFQALFPGCRTVRSHCFYEHSSAWEVLTKSGMIADSQICTLFQGEISPLLHHSGMWRFPVYFEDDLFFGVDPHRLDLEMIVRTLFSPGLKILNFHPSFFAANIPSTAYYESIKSNLFAGRVPENELIYLGRGTKTIFEELIDLIFERCGVDCFISFEDLVDQMVNVPSAYVAETIVGNIYPGPQDLA